MTSSGQFCPNIKILHIQIEPDQRIYDPEPPKRPNDLWPIDFEKWIIF